jgi:hypothetical protein
MATDTFREAMIVAEDGCWLQTVDGWGEPKVSYIGFIGLDSARKFCREAKLDLIVCRNGQQRVWQLSRQTSHK